jgi:hypothetical protein
MTSLLVGFLKNDLTELKTEDVIFLAFPAKAGIHSDRKHRLSLV